jgi:pyruvate,orthophosphate dikinase
MSATTVMQSYEGRAAQQYRQAAGIDGDWRTPVIVQAMVYGNMEMASSGAGVVSYSPFNMDLKGDFSYGDQGADVVDGKVMTIPVYDHWKQEETMASNMPDQWKRLSSMIYRISERLHLDVGLEYTIEKGEVYVLQIRKQKERPVERRTLAESHYNVIAKGAGVSGNIFRGIMVTDSSQIAPYRHLAKAGAIIRAMNKDLPDSEKLDGFIFVVNDPIPEEIMEEVFSLPVPTALVSRLGGRGAHVGDIAKALGRVYVGQVKSLEKFFGKPARLKFGETDVVVGAKMIIHGQTGEIALYESARSG